MKIIKQEKSVKDSKFQIPKTFMSVSPHIFKQNTKKLI